MHTKTLFLATLLATACGTEKGGGAATTEPDHVVASDGSPTVPAQTATTEKVASGSSTAMLVADTAALPVCDATNDGALAYVRADSAFRVCSSATWTAIDLRGADGKDGKDGITGKDGARGDKGDPGDAVEPIYVDGEYWNDPFTNITWRLGGVGGVCPIGYHLPTLAEIGVASSNGIFVAIGTDKVSAYKLAWTSTTLDGYGALRFNFETGDRFNQSNGAPAPVSNFTPAAAYCIKE